MVMYKIDRRGGGSKNRSLGRTHDLKFDPCYYRVCYQLFLDFLKMLVETNNYIVYF